MLVAIVQPSLLYMLTLHQKGKMHRRYHCFCHELELSFLFATVVVAVVVYDINDVLLTMFDFAASICFVSFAHSYVDMLRAHFHLRRLMMMVVEVHQTNSQINTNRNDRKSGGKSNQSLYLWFNETRFANVCDYFFLVWFNVERKKLVFLKKKRDVQTTSCPSALMLLV